MRKKYLSALLFGAILVTSAGTFTSCKDYDDEIAGLQEQVDALKGKTTVSPEEMQTAVSDAISALETKLNQAIAGKADAAEVTELISTVAALQELVNSNDAANKEEIEALKAKIETLSAAVNAIPGDLNTTLEDLKKHKTEVEAAIAEINAQLEENGTVSDEMKPKLEKLTADLAEANNNIANVEALAKNNAEAIVSIQAAISDLETLRANITSLQNLKADKDYVDAQIEAIKELIPTDYLTAEGVSAAIESALENYVSLDFMAAYSTTVEMQTYVGTEIAAALATVDSKIAAAFTANGYNKTDFEAVVAHMTSVNTALTNNQFTDIDDLINTVKNIKDTYATSQSVNDLTEIVGDENSGLVKDVNALNDWIINAKKQFERLDDEIGALRQAIGDIQSMVKSIVFVPDYEDGKVLFQNIQFKDENDNWITKYNDNSKTLTFRVSPATAAATLAERYDIRLYDDLEVKSRSDNSNFEIVGDIIADKDNIGLITVKLKSVTDKASRAIALALEPKSFYNQYDNITSDYIVAKTSTVKIEDVQYDYEPDYDATILYNGDNEEEKQAVYSNGIWKVKLYNDTDYQDMSNYPLIKSTDFDLSYSLNGTDKNLFSINNNGIVTLKNNIISNVGKNVEVYSNVKLDGFVLESENSNVKLGTVEVKAKAIKVTAPEIVRDYKGNGTQTVEVDMLTLLASKGFDSAFITNILGGGATSTSSVDVYDSTTDAPVSVTTNSTDYKLGIILPSKTVSGTHNIIVTLGSSTFETKVEVTVPVIIKDASLPYLLKPNRIPERWEGDVVTLNPRANGNSLEYSNYSFDSMFNWGDYNGFAAYKNEIVSLGGSVTISALTHEGKNVDGYSGISFNPTNNTLSINPATYRTDVKTSLTITATYGGDTETVNMVIGVVNVSGSWKITTTGADAQKTNFDLIFRNNGESEEAIIKNIEWKDALGNEMWKNNKFVDTYQNAEPAGFGVKYRIKSDDVAKVKRYIKNIKEENNSYYVTLTAENELQFESATDVSFTEFEFNIVVEPYAPFGPIEGYDEAENTLTIKLRP